MAETPYGILLTTFFSGTTGMRLQARGAQGKDPLILGAFLSANEWANMIGLYELSLMKLARKLPILKGRPVIMRAFAILNEEQFAHYDEDSEFVWVREMARVRLNLTTGQPMPASKRLTGAQNLYQRLPLNPFLGPFYDRYHLELGLKHRRHKPPNGEPSPIDRPPNGDRSVMDRQSIGDRSAIDRRSVSPQTPLPVPEISTSDQEINDQVPGKIKAAAAPRVSSALVENPQDNVEAITAVIVKDVLPLMGTTGLPIMQPGGLQAGAYGGRLNIERFAELQEAIKERCARLHIAYNSDVVDRAIESALVRYRLRSHVKTTTPRRHTEGAR